MMTARLYVIAVAVVTVGIGLVYSPVAHADSPCTVTGNYPVQYVADCLFVMDLADHGIYPTGHCKSHEPPERFESRSLHAGYSIAAEVKALYGASQGLTESKAEYMVKASAHQYCPEFAKQGW
jgi:hypothetical protein